MYGAIPVGSEFGISDVLRSYLGGGTFAKGDLVMLSSGEAVVATATNRVIGVANEAATSSSTNVEINVTPGLRVIMDNDNDSTTFAASHVGTYFDMIGSTGAHLVDTSSTTTAATLYCLAYNPQGYGFDTDTSIGLFMLAETQYFL